MPSAAAAQPDTDLAFNDLLPFARRELERDQPGGWMHPRLLLFRDRQAVFYGRSRSPRRDEDPREAARSVLIELGAVAGYVCPTEAACLLQVKMSAVASRDGSMDPLMQQAVLLSRAWSDRTGQAVVETQWQTFGRDDEGRLHWGSPEQGHEGSPLDEVLRRTIGHGEAILPVEHGLPLEGLVYALTKFGHVLAVHKDHKQRLGLDRPVAPRMVREADRDRARRLQRRHRANNSNGARP